MKFCNESIMVLLVTFAMQIEMILMQVAIHWKVFPFHVFFLLNAFLLFLNPQQNSFLNFSPI